MSLAIWSNIQSTSHPLYLVTTIVFLAGLVPICTRISRPGAAAEAGAIYGFVFGVAVWGSLGYYFDLSAYQKLFHAGAIVVDAMWLSALGSYLMHRRENRSAT